MNYLEEAKRTAKKLHLSNTFAFLDRINDRRFFKIESKFPTINGIKCEVKKGKRGFIFSCDSLNPNISPVRYQSENYGFNDSFELVNDKERVEIKKGIGSISLKLARRFASTGEFWEIESNFSEKEICHRAIIKLDKFLKAPVEFIKSGAFDTDGSLRVAGFVALRVCNRSVGIFDYNHTEESFLFIDCYDKINFQNFQKILETIIYNYALISGCLVRDEMYILQSVDSNFVNITGYQFSKIEGSQQGSAAINPKLQKEFFQSKITAYFPIESFQNMIQEAFDEPRLLRAIKIITESFIYPLEIRAATYSVALETIKNIILEKNEEKVNPFKSKSSAQGVIKKLKEVIESTPNEHFNNKKAVISRIEQINQVSNTDGFLLAYKILGIGLTSEDEECINMRNDFLHGRVPFENENGHNEYELHRIVFKFHFLVNALIIKMSGFEGYILNNLKLLDILRYNKDVAAPLFRKI